MVEDNQTPPPSLQSLANLDPWPKTGIEEALSREYKVSHLTWAAQPSGSLILSLNLPYHLLGLPILKARVADFRLFAADVKIRVELNSSTMNGGCLLVSTYPFYDPEPGVNNRHLTLNQMIMNPDTKWMSASGGGSQDFLIPWKANAPYCHVSKVLINEERGACGALFIRVLDPLQQPGNVGPVADISVYAQFVNVRLAGYLPSLGHLDTAQSQRVEARVRSEKGVISSIAEATSRLAGSVSEVAPFPLLGAVSKGAKLASGFLKSIGLDQPPSLIAPAPFYPTQFTGHVHGLSVAPVAALSPERQTAFPEGLINAETNPSLLAIAQRPGRTATFTIDETTVLNTRIAALRVHPLTPMYEQVGLTNVVCPHPLACVARPFQFWRGGIRYSFRFHAPALTTAKVRILIYPDGDAPPDNIESIAGDAISKVVDISGDTEVNFTVPFTYEKVYSRVAVPSDSTASTYMYTVYPGTPPETRDVPARVAVYLLAKVRSFNGEPVRIHCHVLVAAASDMQFYKYVGNTGDVLDIPQCSRSPSQLFKEGDFSTFIPAVSFRDEGAFYPEPLDITSLSRIPVQMYSGTNQGYAPSLTVPWVFSGAANKRWIHWFLNGFRGYRSGFRAFYFMQVTSSASPLTAEFSQRVAWRTRRAVGNTVEQSVLNIAPCHSVELPYESSNLYELTRPFATITYSEPDPPSNSWTSSIIAQGTNASTEVSQYVAAADDAMFFDWFVPAPLKA